LYQYFNQIFYIKNCIGINFLYEILKDESNPPVDKGSLNRKISIPRQMISCFSLPAIPIPLYSYPIRNAVLSSGLSSIFLEARRMSVAENLQHEDLSAIETIEAIVEVGGRRS